MVLRLFLTQTCEHWDGNVQKQELRTQISKVFYLKDSLHGENNFFFISTKFSSYNFNPKYKFKFNWKSIHNN